MTDCISLHFMVEMKGGCLLITHTCRQLAHNDAAMCWSSECHHGRLSQRHLWPCHCPLLLWHNLHTETKKWQTHYSSVDETRPINSYMQCLHFNAHGNDWLQIQVVILQQNYQSRFTVRCLSEADNCGFGRGSADGRSGRRGERRSQHHSCEGRGGCCCRSAGLRQEALLDEGFRVWGHLTQRWETSL